MYGRSYAVTFEGSAAGQFTITHLQARNEHSAINKGVVRANEILKARCEKYGQDFKEFEVTDEDVAAVEQDIF